MLVNVKEISKYLAAWLLKFVIFVDTRLHLVFTRLKNSALLLVFWSLSFWNGSKAVNFYHQIRLVCFCVVIWAIRYRQQFRNYSRVTLFYNHHFIRRCFAVLPKVFPGLKFQLIHVDCFFLQLIKVFWLIRCVGSALI